MFSFDNKGSFDDLEKFLKKNRKSSLDPLGQKIVAALKACLLYTSPSPRD